MCRISNFAIDFFMSFKRVLLVVPLVLCSGCVFMIGRGDSSGPDSISQQHVSNSTLGQELIDLRKAYRQDIISQEEYGALKRQLKKQYRFQEKQTSEEE